MVMANEDPTIEAPPELKKAFTFIGNYLSTRKQAWLIIPHETNPELLQMASMPIEEGRAILKTLREKA